jgi:hypothetical protein
MRIRHRRRDPDGLNTDDQPDRRATAYTFSTPAGLYETGCCSSQSTSFLTGTTVTPSG